MHAGPDRQATTLGVGFARRARLRAQTRIHQRSRASIAENLRFVSRHVLLTGFEPFGSHSTNPSELLVRSLEGRIVGGRLIRGRVFPVESSSLRGRLETALSEERPEFAIGLGYAPGRTALALERVSVNVLDFAIPDASGATRKNEAVRPGGPDAYLSTVPLDEIERAWTSAGVPGYVSDSAGTYLCNQWLYEALSLTSQTNPTIPVGFIHLPALPAQAAQLGAANTPSMTVELMVKGIETAIEALGQWIASKPAAQPQPAADKLWIPGGLAKR
jgi:pyroglutamyl-peptidase